MDCEWYISLVKCYIFEVFELSLLSSVRSCGIIANYTIGKFTVGFHESFGV